MQVSGNFFRWSPAASVTPALALAERSQIIPSNPKMQLYRTTELKNWDGYVDPHPFDVKRLKHAPGVFRFHDGLFSPRLIQAHVKSPVAGRKCPSESKDFWPTNTAINIDRRCSLLCPSARSRRSRVSGRSIRPCQCAPMQDKHWQVVPRLALIP